jgi:transposase
MKLLEMNEKEILRGQVIQQLVEGKLDQKSVAERLCISTRQVKRLKRSYVAEGIDSLVSKKRGRLSNRRLPVSEVEEAMKQIGSQYADFGPTLAAEKLAEKHGIKWSVESVRKQMILGGYWKPKKGRQKISVHPLRERRSRRGELIQIDGSPHDWFEGRSEYCCLLVFIDDATSELMELRFMKAETTLGYMEVLKNYIEHHGVPVALYSDRHSIFRINKAEPTSEAQTQFARALSQLKIEGIQANSPQAKGRVERANQTLQDRLIKEMRLLGIDNQESANAWLPNFIADFNNRFAVKARESEDAHLKYSGNARDLRRILSVQEERHLSKNLTCQYEGKLLQIESTGQGLGLRGAKITVHTHTNHTLELTWRGRTMPFKAIERPMKQKATASGKEVNQRVEDAIKSRTVLVIPAKDHPWRKPFLNSSRKLSKPHLASKAKTGSATASVT